MSLLWPITRFVDMAAMAFQVCGKAELIDETEGVLEWGAALRKSLDKGSFQQHLLVLWPYPF